MKPLVVTISALALAGCSAAELPARPSGETRQPQLAALYACGERFASEYSASMLDAYSLGVAIDSQCQAEEDRLKGIHVDALGGPAPPPDSRVEAMLSEFRRATLARMGRGRA